MHLRPILLVAGLVGLLSGHVTGQPPSDPQSRRPARSQQVAEGGQQVAESGGWSRKHGGMHRHGSRAVRGDDGAWRRAEMAKLVVDSRTGVRYNPYSKHHPGSSGKTSCLQSESQPINLPNKTVSELRALWLEDTPLFHRNVFQSILNNMKTERHVCTTNSERPMKSKQAYCKPTYRNYVIRCQGNQVCKGVKLVYETHYKDVVTQSKNEVVYACCPGWTQISNRNHGCNKPSCSKPCLNGGKCVKPELCACLKGFSGQQCEITVDIPACQKPCFNEGKCVRGICSCPKGFGGVQCEIDLNKPLCSSGCENGGTCARHEVCRCPPGFAGRRCETDVDECVEQKPCDHICHNRPGGFECQCKEDFVLQSDGQSCRKEGDDGALEAKDLEFEILDKRLLKLETMMDESHKNDVSKGDLENVYKDMSSISRDIGTLKNKLNDVESYKNDLHIFKNKLTTIEKKAEKVDELVLKYDRMKKCAFYNKICI